MEPQTGEAVAVTTMRAVVHERYGPPEVLRVEEVPRPVPSPTELLVEVRATTVNRTDCGFRAAKPFIVRPFSGMLRPKRPVLGTEFAGVVSAVGDRVEGFRPGDRVFGVHADHFGAHAEYLCVDQGSPVAAMPGNLSFDEAAAVGDGAVHRRGDGARRGRAARRFHAAGRRVGWRDGEARRRCLDGRGARGRDGRDARLFLRSCGS